MAFWDSLGGLSDVGKGVFNVGTLGLANDIGLFGHPEEKAKVDAMRRAQAGLAAYRPEMLQARQNAITNAFKLMGPVNNALTNAYGGGAALPIAQATASPYEGVGDKALQQIVANKQQPAKLG